VLISPEPTVPQSYQVTLDMTSHGAQSAVKRGTLPVRMPLTQPHLG